MYSIEVAESKHLDQINELIDASFGDGFSATKTINSEQNFAFIALERGIVIGAVSGKIVSGCELQKLSKNTIDSAKAYVGILDLIVVEANHRNKGIGKSLFEVRLREFEKREIKDMYLFHWVKKDQEKAFIAEKYGFEKLQKIARYWYVESLVEGYECGECGGGCECECLVYVHRPSSAAAEAWPSFFS